MRHRNAEGDETREALARHYLEKTALPAAEIVFLLGFDEPNSFYRTFRTWTGVTPDRVRHLQTSVEREGERPQFRLGGADIDLGRVQTRIATREQRASAFEPH
jgi:AraC-like DNA-binding protein